MGWVIDRRGPASGSALAAVSLTALLALSACDQTPVPTASNTQAPTAAAAADLMGAPQTPPPSPPPEAQAPPAYAPPPPQGQVAVVTMSPIPNPGDRGSDAYYEARRHRVHDRFDVAQVAPATPHAPITRAAPKYAAPAAKPAASAPAPAKAKLAPAAGKITAAKPANPAIVGKPAIISKPAVVSKGTASGVAVATGASALDVLRTTLTSALGQSAVLATPDQFVPNQPADVTLTVPASFGDTLHDAAQKGGLADAAASASLTAMLSGQGYTVIPQEAQTIAIVAGKATDFHWTVTARPAAKGPLHADVSAVLLGGGSKALALGTVQKPANSGLKLTPRLVGASLLFLIGGLVVAWLARGKRPPQSLAARRAAKRAARAGRPFDISGDPPAS